MTTVSPRVPPGGFTRRYQSPDNGWLSGLARAALNGPMKNLASFLFGVGLCGAVLVAFHFQVPLTLVATVGAGIACLAWLVVIVVLPWNLYFQARHLLFELGRSKEKGLGVQPQAEAEARAVESRMLKVSVGLHLVSAGLLALGAWLSGERLGNAFAALYLLSTLFRPAVEYYRFLRARLTTALDEVKYPRDDLQRLLGEVRQLLLDRDAQGQALERLREEQAAQGAAMLAGDREAQRRLDAVARKFEETIDRLTDNQEIISGIKAFLRLVQVPRPAQ